MYIYIIFMLFTKKFQICQGSCCPAFILHQCLEISAMAKQWPTPTSALTPVIISLSIAKRDKYPCHAKQWPTPTSKITVPWYMNIVSEDKILAQRQWKRTRPWKI